MAKALIQAGRKHKRKANSQGNLSLTVTISESLLEIIEHVAHIKLITAPEYVRRCIEYCLREEGYLKRENIDGESADNTQE